MKYSQYASYKDSGVEWLGQIPVGWEVKRLKYISSVNDNVLSDNTIGTLEIKYIDIGSVSTGYINNHEQLIFSKAPSRARRIIKEGDILISTVRTYLKAIAPVTRYFHNFIVSTGFAVIRPINILNKHFSQYALLATHFLASVEAGSTGVSYPAINTSDLITFIISLPCYQEQKSVVG